MKSYIQHEGRVITTDTIYKHVMAVALDSRTKYREGVIRCITSREGDVTVSGYIDRSELHVISGDRLEHFKIGGKLNIKGEMKIIDQLLGKDLDFIGLEDPDIWVDKKQISCISISRCLS